MTLSEAPIFDGVTFQPEFDLNRITRQLDRVKMLMMDGKWRTLYDIHRFTGAPESSISARLRDLRKEKHGGYKIEHRRTGNPTVGLWEYRMVP